MLFLMPAAASAQPEAAGLLSGMNAVRASNGLMPLTVNSQLSAAAQGFAEDLAATNTFGHVTADGRTLEDRVGPTGYLAGHEAWSLAENVAWESLPLATPDSVTRDWLNSPMHRDNLLDPDLREVGIGLTAGTPAGMTEAGVYFVADFGAPAVGTPPSSSVSSNQATTAKRRARPRKRHARTHRHRRHARAAIGIRAQR